jgi:hypothetical protein
MSGAPSPRWFPHYYDAPTDSVVFVERGEADYRAASFLDDSSLPPEAPRHPVPWGQLAAFVPPGARRDLHYIFHIGHVGSSLISRLLGELPEVLALREPVILRDFAKRLAERGGPEALWDPASVPARLDTLSALLSRTFRPEQRALVKAASVVSDFAPDFVPEGSGALLLYVRPARYLETILAGENSRTEHRQSAGERLGRLHRRTGETRWPLWEMSEGARIAAAWASGMASLVAAADALPLGSVLWMDFDVFLADPAAGLERLAGFFGLDPVAARRLAASPVMERYAKAPDYEYTPDLREQLLAQARLEHAGALIDGLAWLDAAAARSPLVARCLDAAAAAH